MHEVITEFVAAINRRDVTTLVELMTVDHVFTDSLGRTVRGQTTMESGWRQYFAWFPNYEIEVECEFAAGSEFALFGKARGTFAVAGKLPAENSWEIPAAWRAEVRGRLVAAWQVYADNSPVLAIMSRQTQKPSAPPA
jgi:ketosteroid isomerase-like protein